MLADVTEYLDNKIRQNSQKLIFTFYELRVKMGLTEPTTEKFLRLSEIRLNNLGYLTYKTGDTYAFNDIKEIVKDNELLVAVKK